MEKLVFSLASKDYSRTWILICAMYLFNSLQMDIFAVSSFLYIKIYVKWKWDKTLCIFILSQWIPIMELQGKM